MQVVLDIPDDLNRRLERDGKSAERTTLEALAVEAYRSGAFTAFEARRLLGIETQYEFETFLQAHGVQEGAYDVEDLERDRLVLANLSE